MHDGTLGASGLILSSNVRGRGRTIHRAYSDRAGPHYARCDVDIAWEFAHHPGIEWLIHPCARSCWNTVRPAVALNEHSVSLPPIYPRAAKESAVVVIFRRNIQESQGLLIGVVRADAVKIQERRRNTHTL